MHDTTRLEARGIPTVVLVTDAFVVPAREQWEALGYDAFACVNVAHPLGSMSVEQVRQEAVRTADQVARLLTGPVPPGGPQG